MEFNMRSAWACAAALISYLVTLSHAENRALQQNIGAEICYCAPNAYEFTLDFSLTCPPVNITLGDAVAATTCMVSPFSTPEVVDLVPVSVSSIDVLELNQNLQVMVQESIEPQQPFLDGDTFSYISYAAVPGEIVNPEDLPRAIQLNVLGKNSGGEEIINVYIITFTNACGAYPVLQEGQFAGWTRFSDLGPPNPELCPAAPAPTLPPSLPLPPMSMSMSMDMGGDGAIMSDLEDYLKGDIKETKATSPSKSGKSKSKDGRGKSGSKDGQKKQKSKDSVKNTNKLVKGKSKDGSKSGSKSGSKDGSKSGSKDGSKSGSKSGSKDGSKNGSGSKSGSKDGSRSSSGRVRRFRK